MQTDRQTDRGGTYLPDPSFLHALLRAQDKPVLQLAAQAQSSLASFWTADRLTSLCAALVEHFVLTVRKGGGRGQAGVGRRGGEGREARGRWWRGGWQG